MRKTTKRAEESIRVSVMTHSVWTNGIIEKKSHRDNRVKTGLEVRLSSSGGRQINEPKTPPTTNCLSSKPERIAHGSAAFSQPTVAPAATRVTSPVARLGKAKEKGNGSGVSPAMLPRAPPATKNRGKTQEGQDSRPIIKGRRSLGVTDRERGEEETEIEKVL